MTFGSLVPFAEPAHCRVRLLNLISLPNPVHTLYTQDLPSPYYNESHDRLRKAAREW